MSAMTEERRSRPVLPPGRTRRSYSKEFKADAVALVLKEGRTIASVARALGRGESNRGNWVRQARVNPGAWEVLTTGERAEAPRLRRESAQLRMGRDLLKGMTAFWVTESGHRPAVGGWVAARRAEGFPTKLCCDVAQVSRQALCDWRCRCGEVPTPGEAAEAALEAARNGEAVARAARERSEHEREIMPTRREGEPIRARS